MLIWVVTVRNKSRPPMKGKTAYMVTNMDHTEKCLSVKQVEGMVEDMEVVMEEGMAEAMNMVIMTPLIVTARQTRRGK